MDMKSHETAESFGQDKHGWFKLSLSAIWDIHYYLFNEGKHKQNREEPQLFVPRLYWRLREKVQQPEEIHGHHGWGITMVNPYNFNYPFGIGKHAMTKKWCWLVDDLCWLMALFYPHDPDLYPLVKWHKYGKSPFLWENSLIGELSHQEIDDFPSFSMYVYHEAGWFLPEKKAATQVEGLLQRVEFPAPGISEDYPVGQVR